MERECEMCGLQPSLFLHYVCLQGSYWHICTACVLSLHPGNFCPICFQVYENLIPPSEGCITCDKCSAICHFSCIPSSSSSASTSNHIFHYLCPSCSDPAFAFFKYERDAITSLVAIDHHLAKQLLAAATISNISMKNAAALARAEAEIRVRESVLAHRAAKEALERLANLTMASYEPQEDGSTDEYEDALEEESDQSDEASEDGYENDSEDASSDGSGGISPTSSNASTLSSVQSQN